MRAHPESAKILVATDFSDASRFAFEAASRLAIKPAPS